MNVIPLAPQDKKPITADWPDRASCDPQQLLAWNTTNPDYNVGCVTSLDSYWVLDADDPNILARIEAETGQKIPSTFKVHSGRAGGGGEHDYFLHTERSRKMGNRSLPKQFDVLAHRKQAVGPGSIHPFSKKRYTVKDVAQLAPGPDWLIDWLEKNSLSEKAEFNAEARPLHEDFDVQEFLEHFADCGAFTAEPGVPWQGKEIYVTSLCPMSGTKHTGSKLTGFILGNTFGFSCFSDNCRQYGIKDVLAKLKEDGYPRFPGPIWEAQDDTELDFEALGIELVDEPLSFAEMVSQLHMVEVLAPVPPDTGEKYCQRSNCNCGLTHTTLKPETRQMLDELKADAVPAVALAGDLEPGEMELVRGKDKNKDRIYALVSQLASTVKMERQDWLWPERIPCRKITLFTGKPDCGKSLATLNVIARVTTGQDWPDGEKNLSGPKAVAIAASEDDLATTLVPRLKAAGADLSKVHIVKRITMENNQSKEKKTARILQLKEDANLIKKMLREHPEVALIVLDPLTGYFGGADQNKDKEIRPVMESIVAAVEKSRAAVVGIIHNNKRSDVDALGKILGGSAVAGVSRALWAFSRDSEDKTQFYMVLVKSNLSKKRSGMKYKIGEADVLMLDGKAIKAPHIVWLEETDMDANEVLDQERDTAKNGGSSKRLDACGELIREQLIGGPRRASDMYQLAKAAKLDERNFKKARYSLGVVVTNSGGHWWWALPGGKRYPGDGVVDHVMTEAQGSVI